MSARSSSKESIKSTGFSVAPETETTAEVADLNIEQLHVAWRDMVRLRRFEERVGQLYGSGAIGGFCHLYIGQEAVITGCVAASGENDTFITSYRAHGHALATGADAFGVMSELTGRARGISSGKGGSMHMFSRKHGFFGGHGIVGAQVPLGTGLAFAHQYKKNSGVSFTFFGDGAANQGQVFEAFNLAALWRLPVVYIIENNQYAMGTSLSRSTAEVDLYKRGQGFSIAGEQVDGMDVNAMYVACRRAAMRCAEGKGPYVIEAMTYRYRGHSMSDPAKYRDRKELDDVREQRDPIDRIAAILTESGVATEASLRREDQSVRKEFAEMAERAVAMPEPDLAELYTDVYVS